MQPLVLRQMQDHVEAAERADTGEARLRAYEALKSMIAWLALGEAE
jgi:hypothetical protein